MRREKDSLNMNDYQSHANMEELNRKFKASQQVQHYQTQRMSLHVKPEQQEQKKRLSLMNFRNQKDKENQNQNREHQKSQQLMKDSCIVDQMKPSLLKKQDQIENQKLKNLYGKEIMNYLTTRQKQKMPVEFLSKHNIQPKQRSKMVDWMIEVISSYKMSHQTFFLSVSIMDRFYEHSARKLESSELHLVGVTSMWMASKYQEIYPFRLRTLVQKISHNKLKQNDIVNLEQEICKVLGFSFEEGSLYEIIQILTRIINLPESLSEKQMEYFDKIVVYITKMLEVDYKIKTTIKKDYLITGALFVAFKIAEQINKQFPTQQKTQEILKITHQSDEILYEVAQRILTLAKTFDQQYPTLNNLKKFDGFQLN